METHTVVTHDISGKPLYDKWVLWAHLPHDIDWSLNSYIKIMEIKTVEDIVSICSAMPDKMIRNCMLFLMRKGINPTWEDEHNRDGGCFSYKVKNQEVPNIWRNISYQVVGESMTSNKSFLENISGITISPKKLFCIIKIWMKTTKYQNPKTINMEGGLFPTGCIFKRHKNN